MKLKSLIEYDKQNGVKVEIILHHADQNSEGPIIELTKEEHTRIRLRQDPSEIDRAEFRDFRESYWQARVECIRMPDPAPEPFYHE